MVRAQQQTSEFAPSTTRLMTALLGAIAGGSLKVGGIGVMPRTPAAGCANIRPDIGTICTAS